MALLPTTVWEMRTDGSDLNGGGFDVVGGGTDFSQQASPVVNVNDAVTNGTTTITSATANFTDAMIGNLLDIRGGSGGIAPDKYRIASRINSTTITVDRATGLTAGGGAALRVAGALATPGEMGAILAAHPTVAGWTTHVKSGTYTYSTTTINVTGGPISLSRQFQFRMVGYETTREQGGAKPEFNAGTQNVAEMLFLRGDIANSVIIENIRFDANNQTNAKGVRGLNEIINETIFIDCEVVNADGTAKSGFSRCVAIRCKSQDCTFGFENARPTHCIDIGSAFGFVSSEVHASAADGSTVGFDVATGKVLYNCTAYNCTTGFDGQIDRGMAVDCHAENCGAWGFDRLATLINCSGFNNTSGNATSGIDNFGFIPITDGEPLTDPANDDFEPNATALRGALMRSAGLVVPDQTANADIGAVQHADPAGGGLLVHPGTSGGARG